MKLGARALSLLNLSNFPVKFDLTHLLKDTAHGIRLGPLHLQHYPPVGPDTGHMCSHFFATFQGQDTFKQR